MGDYFDDEDLINDYMEEEDLHEPTLGDYDEAMLDEAEAHVAATNDGNAATTQPASTPLEDPMQVDEPSPDVDEPPEDTAAYAAAMHSPTSRPRDENDLYSFERFDGTSDWRTTTKSPTTAREWKKLPSGLESSSSRQSLWEETKARLMGNSLNATTRKKTSNAPDAHLIELGTRRHAYCTTWAVHEGSGNGSSIHLRPVPGQESMSMTLADGTRVHIAFRPSNEQASDKYQTTSSSGPILGVSISELLRRSDAILRKAERQKLARKRVAIATVMDELESQIEENTDMDDTMKEDSSSEGPVPAAPKRDDPKYQLWVDKHAPTTFSHLLSDDRTNREVLRALRAWDPYVFRREPPRRPVMQYRSQLQPPSTSTTSHNESNSEDGPKDLRPEEASRVILLSGPPGVGKTTLAHIIACHAGYRPVEVNASDERSASVLKERVLRAMESSTLNISNGKANDMAGRPNCLILDEIDGADAKASISAIVDIIRADISTQKGAKHTTPYLRRPIIFICNHKYAPALRPLLAFAKQFDVAPPSSNRLVARLQSVLSVENMSVFGGSSLLHQLVAGTGGDIRSCLYTLQFAAARARELDQKKRKKQGLDLSKDASVVDISTALKASLLGDGMKDERNDVSGAVTAIFRKAKGRSPTEASGIRHLAGIDRVLQIVDNFGDNSKTLDCLFTNILQVSYVDPALDRCTLAHEWLSGADVYRSNKTSVASNNHMEHHAMQRYHMPAAAAAVHLLCRVETRADLTFSTRRMADARYQLEANDSLTQKFIDGLSAKARGGATTVSAVIETIPYSLWMLSAGEGSCSLNRAVSSLDILSKAERRAFDAHVALLRSLGLTYVARQDAAHKFHNADAHQPTMRLEPQIDRLIRFEDLSIPPNNRRQTIPSVLKELLAHSTAVEGMRERDAFKSNTKEGKNNDGNGISTTLDDEVSNLVTARGSVTAPLQSTPILALPPPNKCVQTTSAATKNFLGIGAAKARAAKTARKAALVGFDRSKRLKTSNSGSGVRFNQVIRFRYQKGFTQAVRTPCRGEELV